MLPRGLCISIWPSQVSTPLLRHGGPLGLDSWVDLKKVMCAVDHKANINKRCQLKMNCDKSCEHVNAVRTHEN